MNMYLHSRKKKKSENPLLKPVLLNHTKETKQSLIKIVLPKLVEIEKTKQADM